MEGQERGLIRFQKVTIAVQVMLLILVCGFVDNVFAARAEVKSHVKIISPLDKAWAVEYLETCSYLYVFTLRQHI